MKDFKKISKEKLVNELSRAHFMIILLAVGISLLAIINSAGTSTFSNVLTVILVALSSLIALTSIVVVVNLTRK
jgi:hypothetical protein